MIRDRILSGVMAVALAVSGVVGGTLVSETVFGGEVWAVDCKGIGCVSTGASSVGVENPSGVKSLTDLIPTIINIVLYAVGILAVVMVIWGGVQYSLSAGDSSKVTKAKNTIIYGLIGMVIAVLSYAIVNFVLSKVTGS